MSAQSGIFREGFPHHYFLEFDVVDWKAVPTAVADIRNTRDTFQGAEVIAFGADARGQLDFAFPDELDPFRPIAGDHATAAATQGGILVWIQAAGIDDGLDRARAVRASFGDAVVLAREQRGFVYHDSRDLTGFVDGSANPKGDAALDAALIPIGPTAGGSFVLTQRWVHDLTAFHQLSESEQERVIGRTKAESIELTGDDMPPDSHVSRTDLKIDGQAVKIYRRSVPYGGVERNGLYFLAFSCELSRFDVLLRSMFGQTDDGIHDRLTDFSTAKTGAYWFAPAQDALDGLG